MNNRFLLFFAIIIFSHVLSAQTVWSSSKDTMTFTKAASVDWTLAANQDRISDSVWITRANTQSLFNIRKENAYRTNSPAGTMWAYGTTDSFATLNYKTFVSLTSGSPQTLIGKNLVLHLVAENIYVDIKFLTYGGGTTGGGGFSYIRAVSGGVTSVKSSSPVFFELKQNYPNPFNPSTTIGFTLEHTGPAALKIYNAVGQEVATLVNEKLEAGVYHQRTLNASHLSSGMYFARLTASGKVQIRKLILLK